MNEDYKLFLNQFQNVKSLWICYGPSDLKSINVNKNVTKIVLSIWKIYGKWYWCSVFESVQFPNLTDISFYNKISFETLSCLPNVCNNLTSLSLHAMSPGYYRNLKFSALKKFHLEFFEGGNGWSDFVISNPTIETLSFKTIRNWDFNADKLIKVFELLPNLMHLKLGGEIKVKFKNMKKTIKISLSWYKICHVCFSDSWHGGNDMDNNDYLSEQNSKL